MKMNEIIEAWEDEIYEYWKMKAAQGETKSMFQDFLEYEFDYDDFYDWVNQ